MIILPRTYATVPISSFFSLIQCPKFCPQKFIQTICRYFTFAGKPSIFHLKRDFDQPKFIEMFKTIYLNFQSKRNCRRYFRFHTKQHRIIVSLLFRNSVRQKIQYFTQSEHDRFYRSRRDLYQINVLTVSRLRT